MGPFLPRFDDIVLLPAPVDVLVGRLAARVEGEHGARPDEQARVLDLVEAVEPLLRRAAGHAIDTSLGAVVTVVEAIAGASG